MFPSEEHRQHAIQVRFNKSLNSATNFKMHICLTFTGLSAEIRLTRTLPLCAAELVYDSSAPGLSHPAYLEQVYDLFFDGGAIWTLSVACNERYVDALEFSYVGTLQIRKLFLWSNMAVGLHSASVCGTNSTITWLTSTASDIAMSNTNNTQLILLARSTQVEYRRLLMQLTRIDTMVNEVRILPMLKGPGLQLNGTLVRSATSQVTAMPLQPLTAVPMDLCLGTTLDVSIASSSVCGSTSDSAASGTVVTCSEYTLLRIEHVLNPNPTDPDAHVLAFTLFVEGSTGHLANLAVCSDGQLDQLQHLEPGVAYHAPFSADAAPLFVLESSGDIVTASTLLVIMPIRRSGAVVLNARYNEWFPDSQLNGALLSDRGSRWYGCPLLQLFGVLALLGGACTLTWALTRADMLRKYKEHAETPSQQDPASPDAGEQDDDGAGEQD